VPYLGYFREADARREEARLQALGYDTFVRPVSGFSTLGFTSDPIYSSMLEGPPSRIVEVVLHEMLHGTLYLAGHSEWNESLATFVGLHGAALFFAQKEGGDAAARAILDDARRRAERDRAFSQFLEPVLDELRALYAAPLARDEKLRRREQVFAHARQEYLRRFPSGGGFVAQPLNNAVVLAFAVYHEFTPEHERLYRALGGDLPAFIRLYRHAVEHEDDPIGWLKSRYVRASTK
jgi:predicted aminopeptidase